MNSPGSIIIFVAAYLAVYLESSIAFFRNFIGAQIDLLPALMVYASLTRGITTLTLLAVFGGLWFDSLSANPIGVTIFPLFLVGFVIHRFHGLLLREQFSAQFAFGAAASFAVPSMTLLILLSAEHTPLVGWGTIWQLLVTTLGGGLFTPVCFWILDRVNGALSYQPIAQTAFRPDREIKRGRG